MGGSGWGRSGDEREQRQVMKRARVLCAVLHHVSTLQPGWMVAAGGRSGVHLFKALQTALSDLGWAQRSRKKTQFFSVCCPALARGDRSQMSREGPRPSFQKVKSRKLSSKTGPRRRSPPSTPSDAGGSQQTGRVTRGLRMSSLPNKKSFCGREARDVPSCCPRSSQIQPHLQNCSVIS